MIGPQQPSNRQGKGGLVTVGAVRSLNGHRHQADKAAFQRAYLCEFPREALKADAGYEDGDLKLIAQQVPRS